MTGTEAARCCRTSLDTTFLNNLRVAYRLYDDPFHGNGNLGFQCVVNVRQPPPDCDLLLLLISRPQNGVKDECQLLRLSPHGRGNILQNMECRMIS